MLGYGTGGPSADLHGDVQAGLFKNLGHFRLQGSTSGGMGFSFTVWGPLGLGRPCVQTHGLSPP